MQRLVNGSPRNTRWWVTTLALAIVVTLFAGYWLLHCSNGAATPEFCAKVLPSVLLVNFSGLAMSGRLLREPRPPFLSAPLVRVYRPPRLSLA